MHPRNIFLMNLLVALFWAALQESFTTTNVVIGFVLGFVVFSVLYRGYAMTVLGIFGYVVFLVWSIIVASVQVAGYVLSPTLKLQQGIVAIPLDAQSDLEIAILASSITLTPGTISVNVAQQADGVRVLYVHSLVMGDPDDLRKTIKQDFERRILRVTRGGAFA